MYPSEPDIPPERPSPSERMRVHLARARLQELREMDLGCTRPAELILAADRLGNALEDMIDLAVQDWPDGAN